MYDGIVRTLTNVRHVSNLKKNLISLDTLNKKAYKYAAKGGVMNISTKALVLMKGRLSDGLYTLLSTTVIGATATTSTSITELDVSKL